MPACEEGDASHSDALADAGSLDPLQLLQELVARMATLDSDGDAEAEDTTRRAQVALARAQREREAALQLLCQDEEEEAGALDATAAFQRVERQLASVEEALTRVSPEAAALLGQSIESAAREARDKGSDGGDGVKPGPNEAQGVQTGV